ncbi:AzlC family ABC transporter permease [Moritella sp. F3]|uniref:AzlC family ABC transporter permease n=1 Tax=Moritella sp. F3 TaxID=2718882 RepID=UPI0018E10CA5|nr:AzlC family ABC transporter permease [Moritella sp. F3]GIC78718.1 branched-chain amino acid efflux pump permease component 1 AzlC family protein [Moritella sp. F1]GIC82680.1 branched-chain amino acid efflux pump permease component 1 AzlC family protein [Moritella sp. F3]
MQDQQADSEQVSQSKLKSALKGAIAAMPLSIAVIPWGILAGSYAIEAGLDMLQSQAMSAIVFAGAAQLVAVGMIKSGIGLTSILLTTLLITSRHFLYGMAMRHQMSPLPLRWRLTLGFLLTDELFAICSETKQHKFDRWFAFGGGFSFYLIWNIASAVGIIAGQQIPNLDELGLDFAIAATFIALVVPAIKTPSILVSVLVSLVMAVVCELFHVPGGLLIAALSGMSAGMLTAKLTNETHPNQTPLTRPGDDL